jgi:hypothetical protein
MPIQEGVVFNPNTLDRPCGVLFDPPCRTRNEDIAQWNAIIPDLQVQMRRERRHIAILVQCRNTRAWNRTKRNFDFNAAEDYLMAAYSISDQFALPFRPNSVAERWLNDVYNRTNTWNPPRQQGLISEDIYKMFQCSEQGCNLTVGSTGSTIKIYMTTEGLSRAEAFTRTKGDFLKPKFGWQGGVVRLMR